MVADQLFSLESMAGWLDAGTPSGLPVKALSAAS
jgi:hypothetical protein